MIFYDTKVAGVVEIELELKSDDRGAFARCWCEREFGEHGLNAKLVQCSFSINPRRGTLRGMHYQTSPYQEAKLVRCTRGSLYDVAIDLRPLSATFMQWVGCKLTSENRRALYIPEGCAHGFLTLEDNTEVLYLISDFYSEAAARGVRWNDPAFNIAWPEDVSVISNRDREYPDYAANK